MNGKERAMTHSFKKHMILVTGLMGLALSTSPTHAAIITNTYEITASDFVTVHAPSVAPPVDPVKLAFSITFDNSAPITNSNANITLISINLATGGPLIYSYSPSGDTLTVGDAPNAGETETGHNYFAAIISNISTSPTLGGNFYYSVSSPAYAAGSIFIENNTGTVTVGPPWAHIPFPVVGAAFGQTVRLNVVAGPVPYAGPGPLCQAQLNIYDAADNLVASKSVSPAGSVSFEYDPRVAGVTNGQAGEREELRPEAILMPASPASAACQGQATAEVYGDVEKSTSVITPGLISPGANQLPAVQLGPVGLGFLQTMRLNVVAYPPDPCTGILSITDLSGNPLVAPSQVNLTAGQATYIDLSGASIQAKLGLHGEVLASFAPTPGAVTGVCIPSVEVYDQLTGRTQALVSPGSTQVLSPQGPPN